MENLHSKKSIHTLLIVGGSLTVVIVSLVCVFPWLMGLIVQFHGEVNYGEYGDIYGGLNTLFTGLAFVGLVVTILLQHQELKETRDEFEKQTEQFEAQTKLLNEQIKEQKIYNFEQKELMSLQQKKEDVYRRLEYLSKLEDKIEFRILDVEYEYMGDKGPEYKHILKEILTGTSALERIYLFSEEPLWSLKEEKTCEETARIDARLNSLFAVRSKITPWLQCFCDLVSDVSHYFSSSNDDIGKYYRLIFNSCTPNKIGLIYLYCDIEISSPLIKSIIENKISGIRYTPILQHSDFEKSLLKQMIRGELSFSSAKKIWNERNKN